MVCMTLRIRLNDLEDAEKAYLERFGHAAPEYIHGAQYADDIERTKLIKRAVGQNVPLSASEYGNALNSLEAEYSTRFGAAPQIGRLWYKAGEGDLRHRISILKESLETGRRRLMIEYGEGERFPPELLPAEITKARMEEIWLDDEGKPILADGFNDE